MEENNNNLPEQPFSSNREENLRLENEILKLKLQAERGASFLETGNEIPPEIEAQFLQHVQAFEEAWEKDSGHTVHSILGHPVFPPAAGMAPEELEKRNQELIRELMEKGIQIDFLGQYPPETVYHFLTTEFLETPAMKILAPGFRQCFIYEEFHPNHELDIRNAVSHFIQHWFEKSFNEYSFEFDSQLRSPDGQPVTRKELAQKLSNCLDCYDNFLNRAESPLEISFEWNETDNSGTGQATGHCSYDAELENGLHIHYDGPFRFELTGSICYWRITGFEFPGFRWE